MQWFEYLIIVAAIALVVGPIISYFVKKKKGTLRCECGHLQSECTGNCQTCSLGSQLVQKYKKDGTYTYTITIEGMKCGMCEAHINDLIRNNFKVKKVKSSSKLNQTIIISEKLIDVELLQKLILESGYKVIDIKLQ